MFRSWRKGVHKTRAVMVTCFAVRGCAKKPTSEAEGWGYRGLLHFCSLIPANDFFDYAYQDSRRGGPTTFRKSLPAPDFFRVIPPMIGGSKPGPLASFL
jgi:hypothetical protein